MKIVSFDEAFNFISQIKHRYALLGNGFSIALRPDIFTYGSLFDNADFSGNEHIRDLFSSLKTTDFEIVIKNLMDAARVLEVYADWEKELIARIKGDAEAVKSVLVTAIARNHPNRPYDIAPETYAHCRSFLALFSHVFTLNYDVLLYWSLMQDKVDKIDLRSDDGFRHPEDDSEATYVSWEQAQTPNVHYLHGALHLFDAQHQIIKYTWSRTDIPIVEQVRTALNEDKFPLFVAEGTSASKVEKILHNAYLHKALRSFEGCCKSKSSAFVIYGHSLADNDHHVLRLIARGITPYLLVSIYGDPEAGYNKAIKEAADRLVARRATIRQHNPLEVIFYDAASAHVWG